MRTNLFRGYDWDSKCWRYGDLISFSGNPHIFRNVSANPFEFFSVLEDSVGQYLNTNIGSHFLFEGDILRMHTCELSSQYGSGSYYKGKVIVVRQKGVVLKSPLMFTKTGEYIGKLREPVVIKPASSTIIGNWFEDFSILQLPIRIYSKPLIAMR